MRGLVSGVTGAAVKPVVGVLDAATFGFEQVADTIGHIGEVVVNPVRKRRLPHVFGSDDRLLPYSSATARGTALLAAHPLHGASLSSSSSSSPHGMGLSSHGASSHGGGGDKRADGGGGGDNEGDDPRNFEDAENDDDAHGEDGGQDHGVVAASGRAVTKALHGAVKGFKGEREKQRLRKANRWGAKAGGAKAGGTGGGTGGRGGHGGGGGFSGHGSSGGGSGGVERELVVLMESFRRGPGRHGLVVVTTHRLLCAEGVRSNGEIAMTLEWEMPVQCVDPLLQVRLVGILLNVEILYVTLLQVRRVGILTLTGVF